MATLREAMGALATGVTVLSTPGPDGHGMTANAVTSLSLEPAMVLACIGRSSRMATAISHAGTFAISILAADQLGVASWFADRGRPDGARQFDAVDHSLGGRTAAPLITGALAWLECRVRDLHEGGDHVIVVGELLSAATDGDPQAGALLFYRARWARHDPAPLLRVA